MTRRMSNAVFELMARCGEAIFCTPSPKHTELLLPRGAMATLSQSYRMLTHRACRR